LGAPQNKKHAQAWFTTTAALLKHASLVENHLLLQSINEDLPALLICTRRP
jgi:hypothetical protein